MATPSRDDPGSDRPTLAPAAGTSTADPAAGSWAGPSGEAAATADLGAWVGVPGRAAAAAPGVLPSIPGYAVEAEVARGGMGVVYKARHLRLNRPAAIKMILGGRYHDPAARVRFLVEAEAVAAVDHPNVVAVYESGTHDNMPFFALEYVGGGTLAGRLARDGRPAPRAAAELVAGLAAGVAAAHAKGIVHRDLKPGNVLLTEAGEPKVADFGLARIGASDLTVTGAVMGTPSYMSPEQAAGRTREVGTPTDVYALGAILYELLTARPPFLGETAVSTIERVLTRDPDRPRKVAPAVPRDLETICLKCLEKEPGKRYATAAELGADLRAYLDGRPITARPAGQVERAVKWVRRNPVVAAAAAAVALALTAGTTVSYLKYRDAEEARAVAQRKEEAANAEAERARYEADKAKRARDFLVSIFRKAEPDVRGGNLTLRQLLAEADRRVPAEFADQPELRAELLAALGRVKRGIARRTPQAMILEVRGKVELRQSVREGPKWFVPWRQDQLRAARPVPLPPGTWATKPAVPQALVNLEDRLTVPPDGAVRLAFLSDLHTEWVRPGREVTIETGGCEPADAVRERDNGILMTFVRLPKGTTYLGWDGKPGSAKKRGILEDFEIAAHVVTQAQWEAVMGSNPSWFSRDGGGRNSLLEFSDEELKLFPVESVSWDDCQEFLKKLNERERGKGWVYRLPTSAEWEYACRNGATTEEECSYHFYFDQPTNDLSSDRANIRGDYPAGKARPGPHLQRTTRVGAYPPNKLGLCDMHGNVEQWCSTAAFGRQTSPLLLGFVSPPALGAAFSAAFAHDTAIVFRSRRGANFHSTADFCRAGRNILYPPKENQFSNGLRLVRVPEAPAGK